MVAREENLKKNNEETKKLADEELEKVAGGGDPFGLAGKMDDSVNNSASSAFIRIIPGD